MFALLGKAIAICGVNAIAYLILKATNRKLIPQLRWHWIFLIVYILTQMIEIGYEWLGETKDNFNEWTDEKIDSITEPFDKTKETIETPVEKAKEIKESIDKPAGEIRRGVGEHYDNAKEYVKKLNPFGKEDE